MHNDYLRKEREILPHYVQLEISPAVEMTMKFFLLMRASVLLFLHADHRQLLFPYQLVQPWYVVAENSFQKVQLDIGLR